METLRMREAVRRALADELETNRDVILLGEDIGAAGGAFKATEGLLDSYGPRRVFDTPISEAGFLGAAIGAAAVGLRPVVVMMFVEFVGVAYSQLVTEAAKIRYMSRGTVGCPLVVRATVGAGLGFGCQHSQVLDGWFRGTPGLKLCIPSDAASAYGLLRAAIRDDDPVVFLEHKALYGQRGEVDASEGGILDIGEAAVVREGTDVTLVTSGLTTSIAIQACEESREVSAEVVDLLTLAPWDRNAVLESVAKTRRLITVEEGPRSGGWGAEIVAEVASSVQGGLKAPPVRLTSPDVPIPFAAELEELYLPTPDAVSQRVRNLVSTGTVGQSWWDAGGSHE